MGWCDGIERCYGRMDLEITDTSGEHVSPYAKFTRNGGALLFRAYWFLCDEVPNPATMHVRGTQHDHH